LLPVTKHTYSQQISIVRVLLNNGGEKIFLRVFYEKWYLQKLLWIKGSLEIGERGMKGERIGKE
jgi:hypothetical protein